MITIATTGPDWSQVPGIHLGFPGACREPSTWPIHHYFSRSTGRIGRAAQFWAGSHLGCWHHQSVYLTHKLSMSAAKIYFFKCSELFFPTSWDPFFKNVNFIYFIFSKADKHRMKNKWKSIVFGSFNSCKYRGWPN